jgi:23S rRNA (uracil1939-C5)-methyltransferase
MNKNQEFVVTIEDIGVNGEGIGKVDGYTLFIKDAIPGDTVRGIVTKDAKKYGYGRMIEILTPSKERVEARCPYARRCGGCQIQEMSYESQLKFKKQKVKNNLDRIGKLENYEIYDTIGCKSEFRYRNKAQFPIGKSREGKIIAGFYAGRTHSIIECRDCKIGIEENKDILDIIIDHMEKYRIEPYDESTHKGLVRHVLIRKGFATGEIMVCIVINGRKLPESDALVKRLVENIAGMTDISLNINTEKTNVILGQSIKTLYGEGYITDFIGDVKFRISPLSFYQVNPEQTEVLYGKALEYAGLTGNETVFDLYCGVGTISLFLAKSAKKVYGVEVVPQAIDDARINAKINGIDNAEFYVGKAEEVIPKLYKENGVRADVVVVDPPRKGCDEKLLETITAMKPEKVVYVSCDSATLARDLRYLTENGFEAAAVQPVDMFAQSVHVETVVLLSRKPQ